MREATGLGVKLPFASPEEFLERYGSNVTLGGIYIRTRVLHPPGTALNLSVRLADGKQLLGGKAVVAFVTGHKGQGTQGMGIRFTAPDEATRRFLESVAAAIPHARSEEPPLPEGVGEKDSSPTAVPPPPPPATQKQAVLPSVAQGRVVVASSAEALTAPAFEDPTAPPEIKGPVIGIDLGTSNSCAAAVRDGKPVVLRTREGYNTVPSVVALSPKGKLVVGHAARSQLLTNPRLTVHGAKRLLGKSLENPQVQEIKGRFAYEIVPSENGDAAVKLADRVYTLPQISALVLREVRHMAALHLGRDVTRAVITVPAWYNENQRQAVREAGRLAGLHVERIVNEPTAAALAYGSQTRANQKILVYDLGGGTFDASVLQLHEGVYEVLSTGGDTFLGGIDFDTAVVNWLLAGFKAKHGRDFAGDRVAMQRLFDASERAKCILSEGQSARIHVPFATFLDNKAIDIEATLTREELVRITGGLVDRTVEVVTDVLAARGLVPADIDAVLLVGGQSRFPLVREKLEKLFGKPPARTVNPDEAVALGAALLAHALEKREGLVLIDVLPRSIGVGVPGGRFLPLLPRNVALPARKRHWHATTRDQQTSLTLELFQGEAPLSKDNEYLGTVHIDGLPARPRGGVRVELEFELSNECLLKVTAREPTTGMLVERTVLTRDTPQAVRDRLAADAAEPQPQRHGLWQWLKSLFGG